MAAEPIPMPEESGEETTASNVTAPQQPGKNQARENPDGQNPVKVGNG
jgi:hypothetical protein